MRILAELLLVLIVSLAVYGRPKNGEIGMQSTFEDQSQEFPSFNMDRQTSEQAPPLLYESSISDQFGSATYGVWVDGINRLLYIQISNDDRNQSDLFRYDIARGVHDKIVIQKEESDIILSSDHVFVGDGIILVYCLNVSIAVSFDGANTWITDGYHGRIHNVLFNRRSTTEIVIFGDTNLIVFSKDREINWATCYANVVAASWNYAKNEVYYLTYDARTYTKHKYSLHELTYYFTCNYLATDVVEFGMGHNFVWYTTKVFDSYYLNFIFGSPWAKRGIFPTYLQPLWYEVHSSTEDEIFVSVSLYSEKVHLYSALVEDLLFTRIADEVGTYTRDGSYCLNIESFEGLQGVLIGEQTFSNKENYTVISFNHGYTWGHLIAPRLVEGKPCNWPTCYLRLYLECEDSDKGAQILHASQAVNLMIGKGHIYNNGEKNHGFFISTDAGYSWQTIPLKISIIDIIDQGSVIVAYPAIGHDLYYSYDYGLTWGTKLLTTDRVGGFLITNDHYGRTMAGVCVGYDFWKSEILLVKYDFSNSVYNLCTEEDYEKITPGSLKKDQCFQGTKNSVYRRKHNALCRNIFPTLVGVGGVDCPCTLDDFGCSFGYFFDKNDCYEDPDYRKPDDKPCKQGDVVVTPSRYSKLAGDSCIMNSVYHDEETNFCKFTKFDSTISILVGDKIEFINVNPGSIPDFTKIPLNLKQGGVISSFDLDFTSRCLYYVNASGITKACWTYREDILFSKEELFVRATNVNGLKFDENTRNIFYFTDYEIFVKNVDSSYHRLLLTSKVQMRYFTIIETLGIIIYTTHGTSAGIEDSTLSLVTHAGEKISTKTIQDKIEAIGFDNAQELVVAISTKSKYTFKTDGSLLEQHMAPHPDIINFYIGKRSSYYVTKSFVFGDSFTTHHRLVQSSKLRIIEEQEFETQCNLAHCSHLCVTDPTSGYKCLCPETMVLTNSSSECECDDQHPNCRDCKAHQFHCSNQKCVDSAARCNGVNNCEDGSDEENCTLVCKVDEFSCDSNSFCIDITQRCDGVTDCKDKTDELGCNETRMCDLESFQCLNLKCVPLTDYCNGINDCGDNSDEDDCNGCLPTQVKCLDGQCIMPSQICDGVFDCVDWSDEEKCNHQTYNTTNTTCIIRCIEDGRCIPNEKICDHITDCPGGEDEHLCEHEFKCSSDSQIKCASDFFCYTTEMVCDGFSECPDGTDESDCPMIDWCTMPEHLECKRDDSCISLNQHCDGVENCPDGSDEEDSCLNKAQIRQLTAVKQKTPHFLVSWQVSNAARAKFFNITVIEKLNPSNTRSFKTEDYHYLVPNITDCTLYQITVKLYEDSTIGQIITIIAERNSNDVPTNVQYSRKDTTFTWESTSYDCLPLVYFVECRDSDIIVFRNFTYSSLMKIPVQGSLTCKVASCLSLAYNISCSAFSEPISFSSSAQVNLAIGFGIFIPIIIVIIIITVFLLRKKIFEKLSKMITVKNMDTSLDTIRSQDETSCE